MIDALRERGWEITDQYFLEDPEDKVDREFYFFLDHEEFYDVYLTIVIDLSRKDLNPRIQVMDESDRWEKIFFPPFDYDFIHHTAKEMQNDATSEYKFANGTE